MTKRKNGFARLPAGRGAARIALGLLRQAKKAARAAVRSENEEALHDFRVAIRRLRVCLKTYSEHLGKAGAKKMRRRLRDLTEETGPGRDAQVWLEWIAGHEKGFPPEGAKRIRTWRKDLQREWARSRGKIRKEISRSFEELARALGRRLKKAGREAGGTPAFGEIAGSKIALSAKELGGLFKPLKSGERISDVHAARIEAKRLRYLMEPLTREILSGEGLVKKAKEIQTLLGDLHDLQTLALDSRTPRQARQRAREEIGAMTRRLHSGGFRRSVRTLLHSVAEGISS